MTNFKKLVRYVFALGLLVVLAGTPLYSNPPQTGNPDFKPILAYIASGWDQLTRSMTSCSSVVDPKVPTAPVLYLPADLPEPATVKKLETECKVRVLRLPLIKEPGQPDVRNISPPGLLFLPNPYVVPGGRFNEMYGWDSYFILRGLLEDGRVDLARGMVENFFFEIEHYGTVLNANRTYYLTRSQPPFLTSMILDVYNAEKAAGHADPAWLEKAYGYASKDYELWAHQPHLAGETGLARYFDFGEGPVAEGLQDETGYYRTVASYFVAHPDKADNDLVDGKSGDPNPEAIGFPFTLQVCEKLESGPKCDPVRTLFLSSDFYKGDRSMRESGFDISFRFGPYGAQTHHYAPVCLNSLLYKSERDLEQMSHMLGKDDQAASWQQRAELRKKRMNQYLWDQQKGMFFDYDVQSQTLSTYDYITTFYPLWAGLATPEQAKAVDGNVSVFEQPGGLVMSRDETGAQWDYPYGWAPTQLLAIEGLRKNGFEKDANRVSCEFLTTINDNFRRDGTIREKYNVVTRSSETNVTTGYKMNVIGFGWTNAAFLALLHEMPKGTECH